MTKIRVYEQPWSGAEPVNVTHFSKAMQVQPDKIFPMVTHILGSTPGGKFPLLYATEGKGKIMEISGHEYEFDIIGDYDKTLPLSETVSVSQAGRGGVTYRMKFDDPDGYFSLDAMLVSPSGKRVKIMNKETDGNTTYYDVQLLGGNLGDFVPSADLQKGVHWSAGPSVVSLYGSRGTYTSFTAPYKVRGQITRVRSSFRYQGNVPNKIMMIEIDGKKYWYDFLEWQWLGKFRAECEYEYLYGVDNRDANGRIFNKDFNGQPIPIGDGILNQITNRTTYARMTAKKLHETARYMFDGQYDATESNILLMTGRGGMDQMNQALHDLTQSYGYTLVSSNFIKPNANGKLTATGYFDTYKHIDGHTISLVYNPQYDYGKVAKAQRNSGQTYENLPFESYRMTFIDNSKYDGMDNLVMVAEKGVRELRWFVLGGGPLPRDYKGNTDVPRASEIDGSSVHLMKSGAPVLRRGNTSLDMKLSIAV